MPPFPDAAILILPAVALAAGVDLYLTLLFLSAAPVMAFWPELPGSLADLASPGVILVTGVFYLAELAADRTFATSLVWNGLHTIIRPVAGALLALLILAGKPPGLLAGGALLSAVLASGGHAVATGGSLLLRLERTAPVRPLLASLLEDVGVLGLLVLAMDRPAWSAVLGGVLVAGALPLAGSQLRAFVLAVRLAVARLRSLLAGGAWTRPGDFPRWLRETLAHDATVPGGLRGTPAAGLRLPGRPRLVLGWVVVRGQTPLFVHGRRPGDTLDLGELQPRSLEEEGFLRSAALSPSKPDGAAGGAGPDSLLLLPRDGPSVETLRSEFRLD